MLSSMLAFLLMVSLFRSGLGSYVLEASWVQCPCCLFKKQSHSRFPGPLALEVSLPLLLRCFLSLRCRNWVVNISIGAGQLMVKWFYAF